MNLRRVLQGVFLFFFFLLFFVAPTSVSKIIPPDIFLRSDPLAAAVVFLMAGSAAAVFLPALILIGSGLIMGRAFCGYVCPLGTLLDLGGKLVRSSRSEPSWLQKRPGIPLWILVLVLFCGVLGFTLLAWLDPLVLLSRTTALLFQPWLMEGGSVLLDLARPWASTNEWFWLSDAQLQIPRFWLSGLSLFWMGGIITLSLWRSRLWCRALCPLGSMLGLLGHRAPLARSVNESCLDCGACQEACPMGAIEPDPHKTSRGRCLLCGRCGEVCPAKAIGFLPKLKASQPESLKSSGMLSRRSLLTAGAVGLAAGLTVKVDAGRAAPRDRLIRPPGAVPEPLFLERCLRCGLCMSVCMSHTIQPSLWQAGLDGIWSPRLDLRLAPCEKHCNRCGQVCPTQAIRPLTLEERTYAKIGTAILLKERCLVWEQDKTCLVCDEICPYDAIEFREVDGKRRPFVTENRCNGCGYCEHKCPVQGESAIVVARMGEIRLEKGSFVQEAKRKGFVFEGGREQSEPQPLEHSAEGEFPPGFLRP